jgi:hypothetical protein
MFITVTIIILTAPLKMSGRCACANLFVLYHSKIMLCTYGNKILKKFVSPWGGAVQVGKHVVKKNDGEGTDYFLCAIRLLGSLFLFSSP